MEGGILRHRFHGFRGYACFHVYALVLKPVSR